MTSTAGELFAAAGLEPGRPVRWDERVPLDAPGVYAVALTADVDSTSTALADCPLSLGAVEQLLNARPELALDGERPARDQLAERVRAFWRSCR